MKRILAITLTLVMLLAALTGCMASKNPSGNEGEQNPSGKRLPITLTIAETLPSCVAFEYKDEKPYCFYAYDTEGHLYRVLWNDFTGLNEKDVIVVDHNDDIKTLTYDEYPGGWTPQYEVTAIKVSGMSASCISKNEDGAYILTLPNSGETIKLRNEQILYVPYITDELVETAENKINEAVSAYSNSSDFYLQINDGYLCLVVEVIKQLDPSASQETEGEVVGGGCSIDHEHIGFSERISTQALEIGSSENPQTFKLTITGDYADNIVNELEGSYLAGEKITIQLETITEHYYVVTMNGITLPQTESSLEYTWFGFRMPDEDVVISITQKGVDIPPTPADSDDITFQYGDILSQVVLDNAQKETVHELLADKHNWIDEMPELVVNGYFTGFAVKAGYCINSGMLIDYIGERSRQLTPVEKEWIENLISCYTEDLVPSGYEVEIKLFQYAWDGWGISTKTVGACDVACNIIDALKAMKETGETVPMISDEVFEIGGGQYAAERGTMWIESGKKIYRLTPDLSQICLVETHFGEGKVLEITDAFKTNVNNAWHYAPYDYYKGTYNKGDYTVDLESVFKSGSTVQLSIKKIQIESGYDPNNTLTVEMISSVDQEVNIKLHCQQSDDNLAAGDYRTVQLKKGEPTTVDLTFGGWPNFTYWVYIEADFTKAEITINP